MASRPWTLADIPDEVRAGGSLFEPENAVVGGNNQISSCPDSFGTAPLTQANSGNQIYRGDRLGYPSFVWPDTISNRFMTASVGPLVWMMFVAQWKTGTEAVFSNNSGLAVGSTGNPSRVFGSSGTPNLWGNVASSWAQQASINARPYTAKVLPLPMSMVEVRNASPFPSPMRLGYAGSSATAWNGPMWLVLGLCIEPTEDLLARIQGYVAWQFGLQADLPPDHAYRDAPPMVVDALPIDAIGSAVLSAQAGGRAAVSLGARGGSRLRFGAGGRSKTGIGARAALSVGIKPVGNAGVSLVAGGGAKARSLAGGMAGMGIAARARAMAQLLSSGFALVTGAPQPPRRGATTVQSKTRTRGPDGILRTRGPNGRTFTRKT
ncbi:hypothetical protein QCN27_17750 [Cereibacter sp. SYSU M97828]|nr:hypothetical protein [Cereibacter flavus]